MYVKTFSRILYHSKRTIYQLIVNYREWIRRDRFGMFVSNLKLVVHWMTHPLVLRVIPGPSPSPSEQVLVRIIIRSVLMLGRRTFGATTPHASLSRRLIDNVTFLDRFDGTCGGSVHGDPKAVQTRLWWLGAISAGRLAALNSSKNRSSTCCNFLAEHSTNTHCESWVLQYEMASSFCTVLEGKQNKAIVC